MSVQREVHVRSFRIEPVEPKAPRRNFCSDTLAVPRNGSRAERTELCNSRSFDR
jgi:hypothetical protein